MDCKPLIIIVDDNEADRMLLKIAMEDVGCAPHVVEYKSGAEFLEFARDKCAKVVPHVVILDLELPKLPGMEILKFLKDNPHLCSVPIIVFTPVSDKGQMVEAKKLGAIKYFVKPTTLKGYIDLAKFIKEHISPFPSVS
jgi:FixJ family two-component response regulator